jgi:SAM-dependent methyltransferase
VSRVSPDSTSGEGPRFPDGAHSALAPLRGGHFWFRHRRICIVAAAAACLAGREKARVLELGCGDGDIAGALSRRWWTVGLERRIADLAAARRRSSARFIAAEGDTPPFRRCFDLVGLFDVLEHVRDDLGLLGVASAFAVAGGWILITVPADPRLWSKFDRYAGHYRRYSREALADLLRSAALDDVRIVPLFRTLWPLGRIHALTTGRGDVEDPSEEYRVGRIPNWLLARALSIERRVLGRSLRGAGTSWLAAGRVP